jgi:hypothetical protein
MVPIQGHLERLGRDSETGGAEEGTPVPSTAGCGSGNKKKINRHKKQKTFYVTKRRPLRLIIGKGTIFVEIVLQIRK